VSVGGLLVVDAPALARRLRVVEGFGPEIHTKARQSFPLQLLTLTVSRQDGKVSDDRRERYCRLRGIPVRTAVSPRRGALSSESRNPRASENGRTPSLPSSCSAPFRTARRSPRALQRWKLGLRDTESG